jgi:UDP-2-acetamido-3-amino-2,3-dideoxy-glucuronate N-acetyltransferase
MAKLIEKDGVKIHPSAEVNENAQIGEGTFIWNNAQVREKVIIGKNCIISKDVYIDFKVTIGNNVQIQNGVSVYHGVTIEDDVFLGPHMTFTNDLYPRAFIKDFKLYSTLVKKGASIGANATIICGVTINEYAMIGSGCVVTKDVPPYALVVGNPGRIIGFVDKNGKKLIKTGEVDGFVIMKSSETGEIYKIAASQYNQIKHTIKDL